MNPKSMQKPVAYESADDANRRVADETKPVAPYNLARQPSGNEPDDQNDNQTLVRQMHVLLFALCSDSRRRLRHCKQSGRKQTWELTRLIDFAWRDSRTPTVPEAAFDAA